MPERQGALRKAAVLIASLDSKSADALLDQMSPNQAARVRSAVFEIGDVSPAEQHAVIDDFLRGGGRPAIEQPDGIELDDSLARKIALSRDMAHHQPLPAVAGTTSVPEKPPFRFLHEAAIDTLCKFLEREQPQTIAVVVSRLPPERAAVVVTQLPPTLRADVLKRVAELDLMDPDVLRDVEQELESLLVTQVQTVPRRAAGIAAVSAILDAMDSGDRKDLLSELAARDERLAVKLHRVPPHARSVTSAANAPDEADRNPRLRTARPNVVASRVPLADAALNSATDLDVDGDDCRAAIDFDFADVEQLDHRSLALLLHETDPQVTLLALTGAERPFVERILEKLSAKEGRTLHKRLHQLGPLRLSDVEDAQQELAATASQLAGRGLIPLPQRRTIAA